MHNQVENVFKEGSGKKVMRHLEQHKSRSELAPGNVFHPRDESGKIEYEVLQPFWFNIKEDPEQ